MPTSGTTRRPHSPASHDDHLIAAAAGSAGVVGFGSDDAVVAERTGDVPLRTGRRARDNTPDARTTTTVRIVATTRRGRRRLVGAPIPHVGTPPPRPRSGSGPGHGYGAGSGARGDVLLASESFEDRGKTGESGADPQL